MKIKKLLLGIGGSIFLLLSISLLTDYNPLKKEENKGSSILNIHPDKSAWDKVVSQEISIDEFINALSLEEKVGQLLMPDYRDWNDIPVTSINDEIRSEIKNKHIGGVILFKENFQNRAQSTHLINDMQNSANIPLMIGVDQEGGLITRIPFIPPMPGNMALGATNNIELAREVGLGIGSELKSLGIDVNFGPVLDVNNNRDNPVIGVRAFGDDPKSVIEMGTAYMEGLHEAGVMAVGKHFPGHGDVSLDSHFVLPTSNKTIEDLNNVELKPFQAIVESGIEGIMTAHITFPNIEEKSVTSKKDGLPIQLPATLSPTIITETLRNQLSFQGLIFTDAMDMKAISDHFGTADAAVRAIEAGVDIVLMPENVQHAYDGILAAVKSGRIQESRIDTSVKRILEVKASSLFQQSDDFTKIETKEVIEIENRVAKAAITVLSNDGIFPLNVSSTEKIAVVATDRLSLTRLSNATKAYQWRIEPILLTKSKNGFSKLTQDQIKLLNEVGTIIIATNTSNKDDLDRNGWQMGTVQALINLEKPTIIISTRNPYDSLSLEGYNAFVAQYDTGIASFKAMLDVLFGKEQAKGILPVSLGEK